VGLPTAQKKKEEDDKKKAGPKKTLNMGRAGLTAGLDDYVYEDAGDADDDFM
jgi:translation initiation factor 3 subunit J